MKVLRTTATALLLSLLTLGSQPRSQAKEPAPANDVLLTSLQNELQRGQAELARLDPAPYFMSYSVADSESLMVVSAEGGILTSRQARRRMADVSLPMAMNSLSGTGSGWRPIARTRPPGRHYRPNRQP